MLSTSPSKATVASSHASSVSSQPIPIVLQEKHNPYVTDKGHLVTWLDAMKAQSPPQFHSLHGDTPESYDMEAAEYAAWLKKHPSALSMFEDLMVEAKAKQVVVFLDYNGTLSPIVEDPDRAYVSDDMRATVKEVATFFPTAIIKGSVSDDYIYFMLCQFPTNVAGWASTTIVTDSLLTAVGIETNPATTAGATAAIKWISKDALGALFIGGRFGRVFDEDPKQWRIYGDLVASTGNVLELLTPLFPGNFLLLPSLGYLLQAMGKGLVGPSNLVAQTHFAIAENVGDVLAKEEVWLVVGELCGLGLGIGILATPGMTTYWKLALTWVVLRILHLYLRCIMVSTLCLYTVYEFVQLAELYYAGSHGMDSHENRCSA